MVDYKNTLKKIHSAMPELTIDELITIMDCITEISNTNYSINTTPSWGNNILTSSIDNKINYSTDTKNSI